MISDLIVGFLIKKGYKTPIGDITLDEIKTLVGQIDAFYEDFYTARVPIEQVAKGNFKKDRMNIKVVGNKTFGCFPQKKSDAGMIKKDKEKVYK